jgi:formate/nitrite transporter FocA (FNT family)
MAAAKKVGEILEDVIEDGRYELDRASAGLALSGIAAGLMISIGSLALAFVAGITGEVGLAAMAVYPIGFIIVILGATQLFTENTVTPVTVVLTDRGELPNMLRLWVVVLIFNLLGTLIFAATVTYGGILDATAFELLLEKVSSKLKPGFWGITLKAVFGGWLVALMAWLVTASRDTISQVFFVYILAFLIPAGGLTHVIAGSSAVLISVFAGNTTFSEYLGGFLLPTGLGNVAGGIILVTLLNYGQVIGSKKRASLAEHAESEPGNEQ